MDAMPKEGAVNIHQMNEGMLFRTSFYHVVISGQDSQSVLPSRQSSAIGISNPVCRIENVCQKDVAAGRKLGKDLFDHQIQSLLEIGDPWGRLFPACSVHRLFARRGSA